MIINKIKKLQISDKIKKVFFEICFKINKLLFLFERFYDRNKESVN